ncbi:hypothetical protein OC25_03600 [Pedobacter kyungheensis]|uniref:HNH nuclease domain-containing protein n=1 Tax=Pedobacter kyungheensis TaxID=1069985 RepID=A0A0C1FTE0_9SPHI|nr:HNH endonuclease domain-containing protein [Pedobacter kyungheensis]KIA96182.1 hypothetical protein OC25_03600 [Pedobacter kyungheensis]
MKLPYTEHLPVNLLAACFNNTSASYKFYWFLSILSRAENGETELSKNALFADMVAQSWFTINYFKVSFGRQDKLQQASAKIKELEDLSIDAGRAYIFQKLCASENKQTIKELRYFNAEVPHRFLSPWFNANNLKTAYLKSQCFTNNCLYALHQDYIIVNPLWKDYLQQHAGILKSFCYWHLSIYLQARNPSVPDIPGKLIKSPRRKSLLAQRKKFWDIVIGEMGAVDCIYTGKKLGVGNYAVEHFLPYAFVSHDLIWNLIPACPSFNSSKSNKLPSLERYFDPYFTLHQNAIEIIQAKSPGNKFLQDYLTILPDLGPDYFNAQSMLERMQPMVTIASNNGFEFVKL